MKKQKSLKKHLFTLIVIILSLFSLTYFFTMDFLKRNVEKSIQQEKEILAESISVTIFNYLQEPLNTLQDANDFFLSHPFHSSLKIHMQWVFNHYRFFESLLFLDEKGILQACIPKSKSLEGTDFSLSDFFLFSHANQSVFWSSSFISAETGNPTVTLSIPYNKGVLAGNMNLSKLSKQLQSLKQSKGSFIALLDDHNVFLSHPNQKKILQRDFFLNKHTQHIKSNKKYAFYINYEDKEYFVYSFSLTSPQWSILIFEPVENFYSALDKIQALLSLAFIFILSMAGFFLFKGIRKILTSSKKLKEQVHAMALGEYQEVGYQPVFLEFNSLFDYFSQMRQKVKQREILLVQEEKKFKALFENSFHLVALLTYNGVVIEMNQVALSMIQAKLEDVIGKYFWKTPWWSHSKNLQEKIEESVLNASKGESLLFEIESQDAQGNIVYLDFSLKPFFNSQGEATFLIAEGHDVTQIKKTEQKILKINLELEKKVEDRTQLLNKINNELAESNIEMFKKTRELERALTSLKEAQNQLIQAEKMVVLGQLISGIAHEINTPLGAIAASNDNQKILLKKVLNHFPQFYTSLNQQQKNRLKDLQLTASKAQFMITSKEARKIKKSMKNFFETHNLAHKEFIIDYLIDMGMDSDYHDFLDVLKDSQSLELVQTAYELSNLQKSTDIIKESVRRASRVIMALKTYIHQVDNEELQEINVKENIKTMLTLYEHLLRTEVKLTWNVQKVPLVFAYPDKLSQVWSNFLQNALQAMDYQGNLKIEILFHPPQEVKVSFIDSGAGIPKNIQQNILNPFFTTKKRGEGSGLGLSIVQKIIEEHNGRLEFQSKPKETIFSVYLKAVIKNQD